MNISDTGLRLIKSFEGYHKALPDGRCAAYQDVFNGVKDKPTIGWGCTEGVEMGMVWTVDEATAGLRRELARHEKAVALMVTVDINQNEFDALVSISYNIGSGSLRGSRIIKALNAGDRVLAANSFLAWNKAGGAKVEGLVSRRMREAALFMKPVVAPDGPAMPQTVEKPPVVEGKAVAKVGGAVLTGGAVVQSIPPAVPQAVNDALSNASAWQGVALTIKDFGRFAVSSPLTVACIVLACGAVLALPYLKRNP